MVMRLSFPGTGGGASVGSVGPHPAPVSSEAAPQTDEI